MSAISHSGIPTALHTSHSFLRVSVIWSAQNQNAKSDFQAEAISGNSKGVFAAKSESSCNNAQALSQSFNIVSIAILVCSKDAADFNPNHTAAVAAHVNVTATHFITEAAQENALDTED